MRGQAKLGLIMLLGILGFAVIAGVVGVGSYNRLIAQHEEVRQKWSQVENVLQRRNDLIPNLVATVKGFAKQEQQIYGQISEALASFNRATTVNEKVAADNSITGLLGRILAVSLQYPELKSNQNFQRLQDELAGTENRIAVERQRYNEAVQAYNAKVKSFPTNVLARLTGLQPAEEYFRAAEGAKAVPAVSF